MTAIYQINNGSDDSWCDVDATTYANMPNDRFGRIVYEQPSAGASYLAQCEAMRDAATDDKAREYWHRHAGAVRKSLAML